MIVGKPALPAISLTTDIATVTGIAEREGMDEIFSTSFDTWPSPATSRSASAPPGTAAACAPGWPRPGNSAC